MQARGTDWVALSNGRGQIARSPTVNEVKPLELLCLSDLASSYPTRLPLDCCAVGRGDKDRKEATVRYEVVHPGDQLLLLDVKCSAVNIPLQLTTLANDSRSSWGALGGFANLIM